MPTGLVLDPTSSPANDIASHGPDAGSLNGKTVGFRVDILWRSWDWVTEVWAEELRKRGATVKFWRPHGRSGAEGDQALRELDEFTDSIDVAIVGLGNCGSCTGWTIHDALAAARKDLPTVAICTRHFEQLGEALSRRGGRSGLRRFILPYPLDVLPRDEVEKIARQHFPLLLKEIGAKEPVEGRQAA
jgi:hypothetical protein